MQKLSASFNNFQRPLKVIPLVARLPTNLGTNPFTVPQPTHLRMQTESRFIHDSHSHSASLWYWKRLQFRLIPRSLWSQMRAASAVAHRPLSTPALSSLTTPSGTPLKSNPVGPGFTRSSKASNPPSRKDFDHSKNVDHDTPQISAISCEAH